MGLPWNHCGTARLEFQSVFAMVAAGDSGRCPVVRIRRWRRFATDFGSLSTPSTSRRMRGRDQPERIPSEAAENECASRLPPIDDRCGTRG
jgi:hypothetical protein